MSDNYTNDNRNTYNEYSDPQNAGEIRQVPIPTGFARGVPVLLLALAVFLTLCFVTQGTGAIGRFISSFLLGLFSYAAYILPVLIALHGVFYYSDLFYGRRLSRLIFSIVTVLGVSTLIYVIRFWGADLPFTFVKYYKDGKDGAGLIGSILAFCLTKIIGPIGVIVLTVAVFALYVTYFFGKGKNAFALIGLKLLTAVISFFSFIEKKVLHIKKKGEQAKEVKKQKALKEMGDELLDDDYITVDNGMAELSIPQLGIHQSKSRLACEANPTLQNQVYPKSGVQKDNAERIFNAAEAAAAAQRAEAAAGDAQSAPFADADAAFASADAAFENAMHTPLRTEKPKEGSAGVFYDTPFVERGRAGGAQNGFTPAAQAFAEAENKQFTHGSQLFADSADAVFTKDFDPYDIAMNATLADKRSSRATAESSGFKTEEEALPSTEEEAQRDLRQMAFEKQKKLILERQRAYEAARAAAHGTVPTEEEAASAAEPTPAPTVSYAAEAEAAPKRSFEFHEQAPTSFGGGLREEAPVSTHIEKAEPTPAATPAQSAPSTQSASVNGGDYAPITRESAPQVQPQPTAQPAPQPEAQGAPQPIQQTPPMPGYTAVPYGAPYTPVYIPTPYVQPAYAPNPYAPGGYAPTYVPVHNPAYGTPYAQPTYPPMQNGAPMQDPTAAAPAAQMNPAPAPAPAAAQPAPTTAQSAPGAPSAQSERKASGLDFSFDDAQPKTETFSTARAAEPEKKSEPEFKPFVAPQPPAATEAAEERSAALATERQTLYTAPEEPYTVEQPDEDDEEESAIVTAPSEDELAQDDPTPIPPEEQNPAVQAYRNHFTFFHESETENVHSSEMRETAAQIVEHPEGGADVEDEDDEPPFDNATAVSNAFNSFRNRESAPQEQVAVKALRPDYSDYKFPSLDLLSRSTTAEEDEAENLEMQQRGEKLIETLKDFRVEASIQNFSRGPRITRYEVVPAKGTKSNAIMNCYEDLRLALSSNGMRMESIPDRGAIGLEVPNPHPKTVFLRDLIENEEFLSNPKKTAICIGKDVTGNPVYGDISKFPHILIAGATGMGKSVCINALLISMLYKARPDEVKLILVDPKKVEFNVYKGIPHLLIPVVTDPKQAAGALVWAVEQMEKRYDIIEKLNVRNLDAYNAKVRANPELGEPLPKIVIVIDELNDLMIQVRDPVENLIMSIAQKARAAGIHLILGTQRPSVDVITGVIKANIPSRISCKVSSTQDSRTILERVGAEKLLNNGDMLYFPVGVPEPIRVQGAFVKDEEVEAVMEALKKQAKGNTYDEEAIEEINRAAKKCGNKNSSDRDDDDDGDGNDYFLRDQKFLSAVEIAITNQKIATSLIQRKLSVGYGKAAKYIDAMEGLGIVGPANGQKPRDVLVTLDEWHEMLARREID